MENQAEWHGAAPDEAQYAQAMKRIGGAVMNRVPMRDGWQGPLRVMPPSRRHGP